MLEIGQEERKTTIIAGYSLSYAADRDEAFAAFHEIHVDLFQTERAGSPF